MGLDEPEGYTGHSFRRCSASFLADSGADLSVLKRHGGWKSTTVAEGYIENSMENKIKIANQIIAPSSSSADNKTVNLNSSEKMPAFNFSYCNNININITK